MSDASTNAPKRRPLENVRAEDFIEYFLFPSGCSSSDNGSVHSPNENTANVLEQCVSQCTAIAAEFCANYIWHKDGFKLAARFGNASLLHESAADATVADNAPVPMPPHLHGITYFDDNIQDEWFVLALLFELTRRIDGLIVRAFDADGEFVLIEAADKLPAWANPETCAEKVSDLVPRRSLRAVHQS